MDIATGFGPRKFDTFDAELELRSPGTAASTAKAGDVKAPDWASSAIDVGPGAVFGRCVIKNMVVALQADNTTLHRLILVGLNSAADTQVVLGEIQVGCKEVTPNTNDTSAAGTGLEDIDIWFSNVKFNTIWPKIKLLLVSSQTGSGQSIDFSAYLSLCSLAQP